MSEFRRDPITGRWAIVAESRRARPDEYAVRAPPSPVSECPFCEGNEARTPPEVAAFRDAGSPANGPGWTVRTIPNKFPTVEPVVRLPQAGAVPRNGFERRPASGIHEVIVQSPSHIAGLAALAVDQCRRVVRMMRDRVRAVLSQPWIRSAVLFENSGPESGGTLFHPHLQVVGLPGIPAVLDEERRGAAALSRKVGSPCPIETVLGWEQRDGVRMVAARTHWSAFAPFASGHPYEVRIVPVRHLPSVEEADDRELDELAELLPSVLRAIDRTIPGASYNFVACSASPLDPARSSDHWHVDLLPRLVRPDGFDLGSGIAVNPVAPEAAAEALRDALGSAPSTPGNPGPQP